MRVYVASSWRNTRQPEVVERLRAAGHEVYDFRHPAPGHDGFRWSEIDPDWQQWSPAAFIDALEHPIAQRGFFFDLVALRACQACVLVEPAGRSAHLELGYAAGACKRTVILLADGEPELMYRLADVLCPTLDEVVAALSPAAHTEVRS